MFADTATIEVRAGKGGDGRMSFRHEKYRDMGGPDGGNGGRGGNVVLEARGNTNTLAAYRSARLVAAEDGQAGGPNRCHGKNGADSVVPVPPGTQVWEGEELLADLANDGDRAVLARGGRGGFGNAHFVSSVRQAPRAAELGEDGERHKLRLELKLVADVGLVGLPNAGKSTLLSVITNARPEIAAYAFTTLTPNLGMVDHRGDSFLVSDIPGLIEGASEGRGLGDEFLRHVERTAVLLHLIDCTSADVAADWKVIRGELSQYKTDLSAKPALIVLTKTELIPAEDVEAQAKILRGLTSQEVFAISAQTHQGLTQLLDRTLKLVAEARTARAAAALEAELPVIDETSLPDAWNVEPSGPGGWRVNGERLEGFARRTNVDQPDAVTRLRDILRKTGVARELRRQGAVPGDLIRIADREIEWLD